MSKISRTTQELFGASGNVGQYGFGGAAAGSTATVTASSASVATLMGTVAWEEGWADATLGASKFPAIEDMNAWGYAITSQLAYLFQQGIAEYDSGTTYYDNSLVTSPGTALVYVSQSNGNVGNALSIGTAWSPGLNMSMVTPALNQGVFAYSNSTTCNLTPKNGNQVTFPSGTVALIPSGGVSTVYNNAYINGTAAQTLSANTLYYAYLWDNGGTLVIDWSTTAYATDATTGITIKSGDNTRVLVGMAYTVSGGEFSQNTNNRQVRSWQNDHGVSCNNNFSTNRGVTASSPTEINTEIRCYVTLWSGENLNASASGFGANNVNGASFSSILNIDGSSEGSTSSGAGTASEIPISCQYTTSGLAEGNHYVSLDGFVTADTGTWSSGTFVFVNTSR